ncbi:MAG: SDR family oxidoreductase [Alphaproteobacteria bacterium]|nr:SDR family oxidoreductase [Alphaproteobacteria bacterium]
MTTATYPSLADRVVFITGGGSGIGAAMVDAFAANGARVVFVDIDVAASEALVKELSGARHAPLFLRCDLTDIPALRDAIAQAEKAAGPIGVLINNAANDDRHAVDAVTETYWDHAMAVNLRHQFFAAQAVRAGMRTLGGGSIINFSSIAWMVGHASMVAYTTAKAAVVGMTDSLARAFGEDNIRVNAIAPGAVITPRQLRLWLSKEDVKSFADRQCLHRSLRPDDIARVALFLGADDSAMITKQCLIVDGGLR